MAKTSKSRRQLFDLARIEIEQARTHLGAATLAGPKWREARCFMYLHALEFLLRAETYRTAAKKAIR